MHSVRIDGRLTDLHTRTVARQHQPYPPLTEATKGQAETHYSDIEGTLAGFLTPDYEREIGVAGYHLHFLDDSRAYGGHALGFEIARATVAIDTAAELHLSLPTKGAFLSAEIPAGAVDSQVRQAEGG